MKNIITPYKKDIITAIALVVVIVGTKVFAGTDDGTFIKPSSTLVGISVPLHTGAISQLKGSGTGVGTNQTLSVNGFTSKGVAAFNQQTFFKSSIKGKDGTLRIGGLDTGGTTRTVDLAVSGKLFSSGVLQGTDLASPTAVGTSLTNLCGDANGRVTPCTVPGVTNTTGSVSSGVDLCDNIAGVQDESEVHMGSSGSVYQTGYYILSTTGQCIPDIKSVMNYQNGTFTFDFSKPINQNTTATIFYETALDTTSNADADAGSPTTGGKIVANNSLSFMLNAGIIDFNKTLPIPIGSAVVEYCLKIQTSGLQNPRYVAPVVSPDIASLQTQFGVGTIRGKSISGKCQ